jgi:CRISPR system Cascade subunit CasA
MNGGSSSRVLLGLAPTRAASARIDRSRWWARDVACLLEGRGGLSAKALIWLEPWPEGQSLDLSALDPLFIEVCRRIRLTQVEGRIEAARSTSKAARIAAKDAKGNTQDPWAPVHTDGESLTLGIRDETKKRDSDWTYKLLCELLFAKSPEWNIPSLAQRHARDAREPMALVAEAFARGQSKTDGFKSRIVPVPVAMIRELLGEKPRVIAPDLVKDIAAVDLALCNGLATVAAGGVREKVKEKHEARAKPACKALERQADMLFFPELWRRMAAASDAELGQLRRAFLERLAEIARAEFDSALSAIPCPSLMRPRAEVRGRQALEYGLARAMKDLKPEEAHVEA